MCSIPEYNPSVFSLTITKSISSYLDLIPLKLFTGLKFTYKSKVCLSVTFTLLNPFPTGVVTGPFIAILFLFIASITCSGSGVPYSSMTPAPASTFSHSISTPVDSTTFTIAAATSGPIPSPGISVTLYIFCPPIKLQYLISTKNYRL